jgi:hypothetical protein
MNTPDDILDHIRQCRHSWILANAKDLKPDYVCDRNRKAPCKLLFGTCDQFVEFPAEKDQ